MTSDPRAGKKLRSSIDTIALEYSSIKEGKGAAIIDAFLPDDTSAEIVQDLIGDIVFRFLLASAKQIYTDNPSTFDASLENFILKKTRLTGELAKRFRRVLKQAVLASEEERPKKERRDRIKDKQKHKNCYICSGPINEEPVLDHVWPRSAGGGNGKSNLMTAHPFCEAVKGDLAVSGDTPVARFAFNALPRTLDGTQIAWWPSALDADHEFRSLVDDIRGSQLKIAVLGRQDFKCYECDKSFSESNKCSIKRRNTDEPWWFANVIVICDDCER